MNLPNKLATLRMILVIPFVIFLGIALSTESTGLSIFMRILSFVNFDGQIARKHNMVTNLGKLIDPLADKLLVISALVVLTKYDQISLWFVLIIIFRELLITGLRAIVANEGVVIAAEKLGKWKTATQMIALLLIILFPMSFFVNNILLLIPVILTVQSGVEYMQKAKNILNK